MTTSLTAFEVPGSSSLHLSPPGLFLLTSFSLHQSLWLWICFCPLEVCSRTLLGWLLSGLHHRTSSTKAQSSRRFSQYRVAVLSCGWQDSAPCLCLRRALPTALMWQSSVQPLSVSVPIIYRPIDSVTVLEASLCLTPFSVLFLLDSNGLDLPKLPLCLFSSMMCVGQSCVQVY